MLHGQRTCDDARLEWFLRELGRFPEPAELIALREHAGTELAVSADHRLGSGAS